MVLVSIHQKRCETFIKIRFGSIYVQKIHIGIFIKTHLKIILKNCLAPTCPLTIDRIADARKGSIKTVYEIESHKKFEFF